MFFLHTTIVCCIESNEREERERGKDGNEKSWKVSGWIGVLFYLPCFRAEDKRCAGVEPCCEEALPASGSQALQ